MPPASPKPPKAQITVRRNSPDDIQLRQIIVKLDGKPVAELMYGGTVTIPVTPGRHRLRVDNTWNWKTLDLNFDVSAERASNFEQNSRNNTLRFGPSVTWRMTQSMVWALNASTTGVGDLAKTNHRRDVDFDIQYSWRFLTTEKSRWKKMQGQFFIRYANRYGLARDILFGFNTLTKLQTFNAGLNFVFF